MHAAAAAAIKCKQQQGQNASTSSDKMQPVAAAKDAHIKYNRSLTS